MRLEKRRIALLITGGYHEHEFWFPYYRFREEGAEVVVAGPVVGLVYGEGRHGKDGLPAQVTHTVEETATIRHRKRRPGRLPRSLMGISV